MRDPGACLPLERSSTEEEEDVSLAQSFCELDDHARVPCLVTSFPGILIWGGEAPMVVERYTKD